MSAHNTKNFSFDSISKYRTELYGISILWIMIFHSRAMCNYIWPDALRFIHFGNMGCEIFLFISGICLYFSFTKDNRMIPYLKKRVIRIWVPLLIISLPYWMKLLMEGTISVSNFVCKLFALDFWLCGDQQIWFASFIMVAYFLYPYFYYFIFDKKYPFLRTVILIGLVVLLTLVLRSQDPSLYNRVEIAVTRFPVFILGVFTGKLVYEHATFSRKWLVLVAACFAGFGFLMYNHFFKGIWQRYLYLFVAIPLTILLSYFLQLFPFELPKKVLRFFGTMSLELYFVHIIMVRFYKQGLLWSYDKDNIIPYLLVMGICIPIAFIASKLNQWFSKKWNGKHIG